MISFENDYSTGAHPRILEALAATNFEGQRVQGAQLGGVRDEHHAGEHHVVVARVAVEVLHRRHQVRGALRRGRGVPARRHARPLPHPRETARARASSRAVRSSAVVDQLVTRRMAV